MRHATGRTVSRRARPRALVGAASGHCPSPAAPGPAASPYVPEPGETLASPAADTEGPDAASDFLRALRSQRPSHRLEEASFSDPLTAAISRFTGTA